MSRQQLTIEIPLGPDRTVRIEYPADLTAGEVALLSALLALIPTRDAAQLHRRAALEGCARRE